MPRLSKTAEMERRQQLIASAEQLFLKNGYENTTVNQIANSLNLAKGTYYYHFRSKEDILIAVSDKLTGDTQEKLRAVHSHNDQDISWQIGEILHIFHDDFYRNRAIWKLVYHDNNAAMHNQVTKTAAQQFTPLFTAVLQEGIDNKVIDIPHAQETAEMLISLFDAFSRQLCFSRNHERRVRIFETLRFTVMRLVGEKCIPEFEQPSQ